MGMYKRLWFNIQHSLCANSVHDNWYVSLEQSVWHVMQIVALGDNLHDSRNLTFWEKDKETVFRNIVCWNITQHAKR